MTFKVGDRVVQRYSRPVLVGEIVGQRGPLFVVSVQLPEKKTPTERILHPDHLCLIPDWSEFDVSVRDARQFRMMAAAARSRAISGMKRLRNQVDHVLEDLAREELLERQAVELEQHGLSLVPPAPVKERANRGE